MDCGRWNEWDRLWTEGNKNETWSMKCGLKKMKCGLWNMNNEVDNVTLMSVVQSKNKNLAAIVLSNLKISKYSWDLVLKRVMVYIKTCFIYFSPVKRLKNQVRRFQIDHKCFAQ